MVCSEIHFPIVLASFVVLKLHVEALGTHNKWSINTSTRVIALKYQVLEHLPPSCNRSLAFQKYFHLPLIVLLPFVGCLVQ